LFQILALRKEVNRTLIILHLDVLIVANQIACFCQLEHMPHMAHWTVELTRRDIANLTVDQAQWLDVTSDALFTHAVTAVEHPWEIVFKRESL
jgi:hypothetical protein